METIYTIMEQIYKERFLKLYNHMKQPQEKLGHRIFDFSRFNNAPNVCGSSGCMAGELPFIFPGEWYFGWGNGIRLIDSFNLFVKDNLMEFFNIERNEAEHLFYAGMQDSKIDPYFLEHLRLKSSALKEEVVENLRRFLVIKNIL